MSPTAGSERESPPAAAQRRAPRPGPIALGGLFLLLYARLGEDGGYQAHFGMPGGFLFVAPSELRFWLAHLVFAVSGVALLAHGFSGWLEPAVRRAVASVDAFQREHWRIAALLYFALLLMVSNLGRSLIMLDMPITDDESAVSFGARMVAEGHLRVPILEPKGAFTSAFTYRRDGFVSSMDFPGLILFGALAIVSRLEGTLYALASAAAGVAVAYAAGLLAGPRARVVAALAWLFSPMGLALSFTTHGHVTSRAFLALALACAARLHACGPRTARRDGFWLGFFAGLGFLCRPFEVAALLLPTALFLVWRSWRPPQGSERIPPQALLFAALGFLPVLGLFAWYNHELTGVFYLQTRFAPGVTKPAPWNTATPWSRLGWNLGWNAWLLCVFAVGAPALLLTYLGAAMRGGFTLALALGIGVVLLVSLGHDNIGVHSVGPIHYSECVVPIVLLTSAGAVRLFEWIAARGLAAAPAALQLAAYLVISLALFDAPHLSSLHAHAEIQRLPYDVLEQLKVHDAIVLAQHRADLAQDHPRLRLIGTWVMSYPPPDPFFRDDVIFARHSASLGALRARFPKRRLYSMQYDQSDQPIKVAEIPASVTELPRIGTPDDADD